MAWAMMGPKRGAITMAPMMTATLSFNRPTAATTVDRAVIPRYTRVSLAISFTDSYISSRLMRSCFF
jgi:hypothetical protein